MSPKPSPLQPGDKAPFFYGMVGDRRFLSSEDQAGRPAALILAGALAPGTLEPLLAAFALCADALAEAGADALLLAKADPRWMDAALPAHAPMVVHCPTDAAFAAAGFDGARPLVLVVDRSLRILDRIEGGEPHEIAHRVLERLARVGREPGRTVRSPAPVLIVPDLIERTLCDRLISHFETSGHVEGAMASVDTAGAAVNRVDAGKKRRRDCTLEPGSELHRTMLDVLDRRLLPEIGKAFQAQVAHVDRILIARYDDAGGYFRRHRDNSTAQVAFRQFALSLNLNTGDYQGGELTFPEFSDDRFSPPAGAACVFSASLLHEALPVTRGRRYVLLSFLHDAAAETRRLTALTKAA